MYAHFKINKSYKRGNRTMRNKKFYGVLLIIVLLISKVFAASESYNTTNKIVKSKIELAKMSFKDEIEKEVEEKTYFDFIKASVPSKFVKPFYDLTNKNKNIGIELLGTAKHESGWIKFEGPINSNGTRDYGPLMLNSANLENGDFMDSFANNCSQYKNDRDIYYMCICINFYKSIRKEYGPWCALQIYNGGWRTVRKSCSPELKKVVVDYANKVYKFINEYDAGYKEFAAAHHDEYTEYIAFQFSGKVQKYINKLAMLNAILHDNTYDLGNVYSGYKSIDKTCLFDEEVYELYVLGKFVPNNIITISSDDIYLKDDEEFFERLLC